MNPNNSDDSLTKRFSTKLGKLRKGLLYNIGKLLELQRRRKTRERRKTKIRINRENDTKEKDQQQQKLYDLERSALTNEYYEEDNFTGRSPIKDFRRP